MESWIFIATTIFVLIQILRHAELAYFMVPSRELRHRAANDEPRAHELYQAARFESRLKFLLEICIAGLFSWFSYILLTNVEALISIETSILALFFTYVITPTNNKLDSWLASKLAPALALLLGVIDPVLSLITPRNLHDKKTKSFFDAHDLIEFIKAQKKVEGSRISRLDIDKAVNALIHQDKFVRDVMIPIKRMVLIKETDNVGPILLSELHSSRQSSFAIIDKDEEIVGTVSLEDLIDLKEGGVAGDVTDKQLNYVNSSWQLSEAARAFVASGKQIYLVVNKKATVVGIIDFQNILKNLIGDSSEHNKKKYSDAEAIADEVGSGS